MIYLDNAATTMKKPTCVITAVAEAMTCMGNSGRGVHEASLDASRIIFDTRVKLADLFKAEDPRQIVFSANSTESLNIAIKGLLSPGDHVVTTVLEHNSVLRPLYEMQEKGIDLKIVGCHPDGSLDEDEMRSAIDDQTRAVIVTHASNLTGNVVDIEKIGRMAKAHGSLFIVDASQTAGMRPIDVQAMNIDVLCFTGHKSLLGPQGTGGMYVRSGLKIRPLLSGGSGVQTYKRHHPDQMPTALEAGTLNGHGIAGLHAALDYIQEKGLLCIQARAVSLMQRFYEGVKDLPGIKIYGDYSSMDRSPVVALNIGDMDSSEVSDELFMTYGIATRPGAHCAPLMHQALGTVDQGAVRFSFSHLNTEDEADQAILAVKEIAEDI